MRIVKPKIACKNCKHITRIMNSRTGKYYCQHMERDVDEEDLCSHYNWGE